MSSPNQPIPNGSTGFMLPPARAIIPGTNSGPASGLLGDLLAQYLLNLITAGSGITITVTDGVIVISASGGGGGDATGLSNDGNTAVLTDAGMVFTDANGNTLTFSSSGIELRDSNGDVINMQSGGNLNIFFSAGISLADDNGNTITTSTDGVGISDNDGDQIILGNGVQLNTTGDNEVSVNGNPIGTIFGVGSGFAGAYVNALVLMTANAGDVAPSPQNAVQCQMFDLPFPVNISRIVYKVASGAGAGDLWGFGIYSQDGTELLMDSGPLPTTATGAFSSDVVGEPVFLPAGTYIFAQTTSGTSATSPYFNVDGGDVFELINKNYNRNGKAANPSVAGQLPSSLGAINASDNYAPMLVWYDN